MQSSPVVLEAILAKYNWITTFTHPPDIASLLRTNEAPSPSQSARLKASLADLTTSLTELGSNLNLLRNAVASLETHMMSLLQSLKHDYETALSPIRHLPVEVLTGILCRSWKNQFITSPYQLDVSAIRDGPWSLGQVCSSWRNAIESLCPELWANLKIGSNVYGKTTTKADPVEILHVVLERSRNHPLDFHCHFRFLQIKNKAMARCFDLLIAHSKRWRDVALWEVPSSLLPRLSTIRGKVDLLRDMEITSFRCSGAQSEDSGIRAFEVAPKLEKLHMYGMPPAVDILFPVSNLVSLSDARPFAGDRLTPKYLDVVKAAPRLRSFSNNDYGVNLTPTLPLLPCVTSLSIENLSISSPSCMRGMKLPSLKTVTLTTMYDLKMRGFREELIKCPVDALSALHQMLLQSQCSLFRLHLIDAVLDDNLADIIRLTPNLQQLDIDLNEWVGDYDLILHNLVEQMSEVCLVDGSIQPRVVPSLQEFSIRLDDVGENFDSFIDPEFADMVALRLHQPPDVPHLTSIRVSISGTGWIYGLNGLNDVGESDLKSLRHEGLELSYDVYDSLRF
ncbi:hypothetical protein EDD18DRAFT_216903 [Armillaria luteobubalina]|uniref:F-box domain-containing protein n=1 Tax=Armillaria luteobubalina TaxID=153913 RepID=A0AA39U606_9AGAR|nr:hypothetical protein EDD18DRAFT_216903 [Armillaria luteobubalina]